MLRHWRRLRRLRLGRLLTMNDHTDLYGLNRDVAVIAGVLRIICICFLVSVIPLWWWLITAIGDQQGWGKSDPDVADLGDMVAGGDDYDPDEACPYCDALLGSMNPGHVDRCYADMPDSLK